MEGIYAFFNFFCVMIQNTIFCVTLQLQEFKTIYGGLSKSFLALLKESFNKNIFFETGTSSGDTSQQALLVFDKVYSTEISEKLYQEAVQKVGLPSNFYLYLGDSPKVLNQILPTISQDIVFWLDAHYCGVGAGRDSSDSPILQELAEIKRCYSGKCVIMIDDLRGFYSENWPPLSEVIHCLIDINSNFKIITFGDSLLAFLPSENVVMSDCLQALTISRFFDTGCFDYNVTDVLNAEEIIAKTNGKELQALQVFSYCARDTDDHYGRMWQALIDEYNGNSQQSCILLKDILNVSHPRKIDHWRINWYLARNAFKINDFETTKIELTKVIDKYQDFEPAQKLLTVLNSKL